MTARALRAMLEGLIDYAGLFPPAALSMQDAVRNYARYRDGEHAWALGRFVVPADREAEVPRDFACSVLGRDEVKASELDRAARDAFVEITELEMLPELRRRGLRAKLRTGGLTAEAFPSAARIAEFLRACREHGVAFKATAGLHHPVRCVRPLTYAPDAPRGTMHGFLNLFLAAAMLDDAEAVLNENDPHAFAFDDDGASWRDRRVATEEIMAMRRDFALSFGSCSFEEPIADLQELGLLS
ncbi:MAG TPA: hypothetical protein VF824_15650 [Thermoanaerobaculia bacterium]|jgi:hypothetical protein